MDQFCTETYPNRTKNIRNNAKFHVRLLSVTVAATIFTKLMFAERHQVDNFYTEFCKNRSRNVEIAGRNPFTL
jgi:hypothetical protein